VLLTCLGGYLSAGGAGAVNHWFDRDIDAQMARTATRPIPSGRVAPSAALAFGLALAALSLAELSLFVNVTAALLSFSGFLGYVFVYTVWLKRRTPQNIVIGGAAGAVPPLVAWAAVDGSVSATAVALFAVVFLWTPPHFWALALLLDSDYARAGVPMLPTVRGARASAQQILVYTVLLVAASLAPVALGTLGWIYAVAAALLGLRFVQLAVRLLRAPDDRVAARKTFLYSLLYLALLFAAMGVDSAVL
jgi:protoheme IX farnesyltransferase